MQTKLPMNLRMQLKEDEKVLKDLEEKKKAEESVKQEPETVVAPEPEKPEEANVPEPEVQKEVPKDDGKKSDVLEIPKELLDKGTEKENFKAKYQTLLGKYNAETSALRDRLRSAGAQVVEPEDMAQQLTQQYPGDFEAMYYSLKGRYDADVPNLRERVKDAEQRPVERPKEKPEEIFTEEFRELHPEDAKRYEEKLAEVKQLAIETARKEAQMVREQTEQSVGDLKKQEFYRGLDSRAPQWRQLYETPAFQAFMGQPDGFSGCTWGENISRLEERGDFNAVANIFVKYVESASPRKNPEELAMPQTHGQTVVPEKEKPNVVKGSEYQQFLDAVTSRQAVKVERGMTRRLTAEEIDKQMQYYEKAAKEGRIDYSL